MNGGRRLVSIAALLVGFCVVAAGHRLDEYLQASRIFLFQDHLEIQVYMTPGVNVADAVFSAIDLDHDGSVSPDEEQSYAKRVLGHLVLRVDNRVQPLRLAAWSFPSRADMEGGVGVVRLKVTVPVQTGSDHHHLYFENTNDPGISFYLMNVMMPDDNNIRIVRQDRDFIQSRYTVDYETSSQRFANLTLRPAVWVGFGFGLLVCVWTFLRPFYRRETHIRQY